MNAPGLRMPLDVWVLNAMAPSPIISCTAQPRWSTQSWPHVLMLQEWRGWLSLLQRVWPVPVVCNLCLATVLQCNNYASGFQVSVFPSFPYGSYGNQSHSSSQVNTETSARFVRGRYTHLQYCPNVYSTYFTITSRHSVKVLRALGDSAPYSSGVVCFIRLHSSSNILSSLPNFACETNLRT